MVVVLDVVELLSHHGMSTGWGFNGWGFNKMVLRVKTPTSMSGLAPSWPMPIELGDTLSPDHDVDKYFEAIYFDGMCFDRMAYDSTWECSLRLAANRIHLI